MRPMDDATEQQLNTRARWTLGLPRIVVVLLALTPLVIFLRMVRSRLLYPFDLEWIEGHMLAMATRVAQGASLYPAPSLEYIPAPYFPLYFLLTGGLVKIFGSHFWVGRLFSVLCTLGAGSLIVYVVRKKTGDMLIAMACAAVFFASYPFVSEFYDLFRVDSLAIFTLLLAYVAADPDKGRGRAALAGVALFAALMAKQNALLYYPGLACMYFIKDWRKGLIFSVVFAGLTMAVCGIWHWAGGGWFLKYTFALVTNDPIEKRYLLVHVWIVAQYAIPIAVAGMGMVSRLSMGGVKDFFSDKWLAFFGIAYVNSYLFRVTSGGARNSYIPVAAACAVAAGVMLPEVLSFIRGKAAGALPISKPAAAWALAFVLLTQLIAQAHWYGSEVPDAGDYKKARRFLSMLDGLDGTYYMPGHVLPRENTFWIHEMSWRDFAKADWAKPQLEKIAMEFRQNKVDYLIVEEKTGMSGALRTILNSDYQKKKSIPSSSKPKMFSATKTAPTKIYRHKSP